MAGDPWYPGLVWNDVTGWQPRDCHCGQHGHAINSINCSVHGYVTMQWQPIETAPKDGTVIVIYCGGRASASDRMWLWKTGRHANDEPRMMTGATHWMPLPEPPA